MNNKAGRFGVHGGQYIPETLMNAVLELEKAYEHIKRMTNFNRELQGASGGNANRPSRLYFAENYESSWRGKNIP